MHIGYSTSPIIMFLLYLVRMRKKSEQTFTMSLINNHNKQNGKKKCTSTRHSLTFLANTGYLSYS